MNSFVALNLAQIGEQFGNYLSVLKDSVNEIDLQIQALNHKEQQIMKKVRQRSNFFCSIGFTFLVSQWSFFYYTIYEVDWLGWDLMEPITFTVSQSGFVLSLYYYLKTKSPQTYENMLKSSENKRKQYLLRKNGVDLSRINALTDEKNRILSLIDVIEKRLV